MHFQTSLVFLCIAVFATGFGAFIEVPDEYLLASAAQFDEQSALWRPKRGTVDLHGNGGNKEGFVGLKAQGNLYSDSKTSLDGTLKAQSQWKSPYPAQHGGMARVDGSRTLFENDKTKVTGSGFAEREVGTGMRPHDSFGAGVGVTHNIYSGKNGDVDVYGGYQRQWNTPNRHNANAGIRWRF